MPLLRYRTGDIAKLIVDPCKCGVSTVRRIGRIAKRVGGMVEIAGGRAIYPSLFDDKLYAFKELVDYRIILTREGDKEALSCKVELIEENAALEKDLASAIASIDPINRSINDGLLAQPKIEFAQRGETTRAGRMKQRIIDERAAV
jgi:phenylacetate-CoA ligase